MELNFDTSDLLEYDIDYSGLRILEDMAKLADGDDIKPMYSGVDVNGGDGKIVFYASSMGFTFHIAETEYNGSPFKFLVPKKFISLVSLLARDSADTQIRFGYNKRVFRFVLDGYEIISRALSYSFPEISDSMFGQMHHALSIGVKPFIAAVNRCGSSASIFAGTFVNTKLKIEPNYVTVSEHIFSQSGNFRLKEKVSCDAIDYAPAEFVLSPKLIKQTLSVSTGTDVTMRYAPGLNLVCFQDKTFTHYIAIVRV